MKKKVSIIIPAYNEENSIEKLLKLIKSIKLEKIGFSKEIICIDDGSTDKTSILIKKFKDVVYIKQKNSGKGAAVQKGISRSKGQLILVQDADLEYSPKDYIKLLKPFIKKKKIAVYGSRYFNKSLFSYNFFSKEKQSYLAYVFNFFLSGFFYIVFGKYYSDLLTGYKVYEKGFFKKLKIKTKGFETDHEITINLLKNDYKILEVPIKYTPRSKKEGKKINFFDAIKAIFLIIKMKFII